MSGVQQGTVLAAILFVIMISDIDENVKLCILRSFADDTRVSKKVICNEDKEQMQEDLNDIMVTGESGAGLVKATATAKGELKGLDIDPSIFNGDDKEVVEDLILAAIKDAQSKAQERTQEEMAKMAEGLGLPPGMKLPF